MSESSVTPKKPKMVFSLLLALIWGAVWAMFLQWTHLGRFLALKRTWLTVVIGIGVDLLISLTLLPLRAWLTVFSIIAISSLPIITRSLVNELIEITEELNVFKNQAGQ